MPPPPHPHPGESDHDAAVRYIKEYVTNNYVDDRDTSVDNSVNQQIDTGGGDVDQLIRTTSSTASGDGAVAAGGDIRNSTVTSGDGNQIGENNIRGDGNVQGEGNDVVSGDHNTTAFGSGAANSADIGHASVSGGGALSVAGDATGEQQQHRLAQRARRHEHHRRRRRRLVQQPTNDTRPARTTVGDAPVERLEQRRGEPRAQRQRCTGREPRLTLRHQRE